MNHGRWILALGLLCAAPAAKASILGEQGIEIEGAHDRRGFFVRPGISFGAGFRGSDTIAPLGRFTLALGAGLGKDTLVGVEGGLGAVFGESGGVGPVADLELTQFFGPNLFLRVGFGIAPVPTQDTVRAGTVVRVTDDTGIGFGGRVGLGTEVWTGATSSFGVGVFYDGRADQDQTWVSSALASAYLAFY